ncbi:MAG TPA: hypothetical protein VF286_05460 [Acidiphilium sp.]
MSISIVLDACRHAFRAASAFPSSGRLEAKIPTGWKNSGKAAEFHLLVTGAFRRPRFRVALKLGS